MIEILNLFACVTSTILVSAIVSGGNKNIDTLNFSFELSIFLRAQKTHAEINTHGAVLVIVKVSSLIPVRKTNKKLNTGFGFKKSARATSVISQTCSRCSYQCILARYSSPSWRCDQLSSER